jgi:hypothetical protein
MSYTDSKFYAGLDLGQAQDYTVLSILERITTHYTRLEWAEHGGPPPPEPPRYELRWLERFPLGTPYPAQVKRVGALLGQPPVKENVRLILDHTGCGRPIYDLFVDAKLQCPLWGITIHGGDKVSREGGLYRVPKRDLVGAAQVLLQNGQLKIASALPEATTLTKELQNFRMKIAASGHDSYEAWREGQHDDLGLSLSLACWFAECGPTPPVIVKYVA